MLTVVLGKRAIEETEDAKMGWWVFGVLLEKCDDDEWGMDAYSGNDVRTRRWVGRGTLRLRTYLARKGPGQ